MIIKMQNGHCVYSNDDDAEVKALKIAKRYQINLELILYDRIEKEVYSKVLKKTGDICGAEVYRNLCAYRLEELKDKIAVLEDSLDSETQARDEAERVIREIKSSRAWRLMNHIWRIRDAIIPLRSRRRMLAKLALSVVKRPKEALGKLSVGNLRKLHYYYKNGVLVEHLNKQNELVKPLNLRLFDAINGKTITSYPPIHFPMYDDPLISIVIPAHNQFDYTYNCLRAILSFSGAKIKYEVILADDASSDLTAECDEIFCGVTVLRNKENLQFIRTCNRAAKAARGKYILFLNNDTQVQPNWLDPLLSPFKNDERVGITGSRFVYPTSELQEAGGIVWRDGSVWNYGRFSDPSRPEFNYVKDVDYISGASILVKKDLWEKIGGFSESYAPAYCEDTDLAFEARRLGYRVVYQPASLIVHFEGRSNGVDAKSGAKKYQVYNGKTFYKKWRSELRANHVLVASDIFHARERSLGKETALYIVKSSAAITDKRGDLEKDRVIKCLFYGGNDKEIERLRQLGIETVSLDSEDKYWITWLDHYSSYIDKLYFDANFADDMRMGVITKFFPKQKIFCIETS